MTEFDVGPLTWVKAEIDQALKNARDSLGQFLGNPGDVTPLRFSLTHMHQVTGAVQMVGLDGVARFSEEIEQLGAAIEKQTVAPTPEHVELMLQCTVQVGRYLDDLINGEPDLPLTLFPLYQQLLLARGAEKISESDLFFPDMGTRAPKNPAAKTLSDKELTRFVKTQRARFQRGLLQWLRSQNGEEGLQIMRDVLVAIDGTQTLPAHRTFWWAAIAFVDALAERGLAPDVNAKQLCARIDLQMRRLAEGSPKVAERLLRDVLYFVAKSEPVAPTISQVKAHFELQDYIPEESVAASPEGEALRPLLRELRELLSGAKDAWLKYTSGNRDSLPHFQQQTGKMHDRGSALDNGALVGLLGDTAQAAKDFNDVGDDRKDVAIMEMATTLLLLENAFEHYQRLTDEFVTQADVQGRRLKQAVSGDQDEIIPSVPLLDEMSRKAQEKLLLAQVVHEMQTNLRHIEEVLDAFFRDQSKRDQLNQLDPIVHQVLGALRMMDLGEGVELLELARGRIEYFGDATDPVPQAELEDVADALSSLGFFIEAVQHGKPDADAIIRPVLRRLKGEPEPAPVADTEDESSETDDTPAVSIESGVESQKKYIASCLDHWQRNPHDIEAKETLQAALSELRQDADLMADTALGELANRALEALRSAESSAMEDTASAVSQLVSPKVQSSAPSEEALRLANESAEQIDAELLETYLEEAREVLAAVSENLRLCESDPYDREAMTTIRRGFHTLKGSGRMVGLTDLGEVAWAIEQVMNKWLQEDRSATPALITLIGMARDHFAGWVESLTETGTAQVDAAALLELAEKLRQGEEPTEADAHEEPAVTMATPSDDQEVEAADSSAADIDAPAADEEIEVPQEPSPVFEADTAHVEPLQGVENEEQLMSGDTGDTLPRSDDFAWDTELSADDGEEIEMVELPAIDEGEWTETKAAPEESRSEEEIILDGPSATGDAMETDGDLEIDLELPAGISDASTGDAELPDAVSEQDDYHLSDVQDIAPAFDAPTEADDATPGEPSTVDADSAARGTNVTEDRTHAADAMGDEPVGGALSEADDALETAHVVAAEGTREEDDATVDTESPSPEADQEKEVVVGDKVLSPALYDIFTKEAAQHLDTLRREFGHLQQNGSVRHDFMRAAHTLCGIARTTDFTDLAALGHDLENLLTEYHDHPRPLTDKTVALTGETIVALEKMVDAIVDRRLPKPAKQLMRSLKAALKRAVAEREAATAEAEAAEDARVEQPVVPASVFPPADLSSDRARQGTAPSDTTGSADSASLVRDDLDEQLLPIFLEEAQELFPAVGNSLRQWRETPSDIDASQVLRRALHTLKGSARMAGAMRLGELTHQMEARVVAVVEGGAHLNPTFFEELETTFDQMAEMLDRLQRGEASEPEVAGPETPAPTAIGATVAGDADFVDAAVVQKALLRVRADVVDRLVNEAGEISIARSRIEGEMQSFKHGLLDLTENVIRLRNQLREMEIQAESQMQSRLSHLEQDEAAFDPLEFDRFTRLQELTRMLAESVNDVSTVQQNLLKNLDETEAALLAQGRMNRELQQELMHIRMVPLASLADRLYRVVRQTAKELGKKANLDIRGGNVEIDRSMLEKMTGPFEHLLRNAVAHGLESGEARKRAGKEEIGELQIEARQEGNEIILRFSDDGAGIDLQSVRERALERGLIEADTELNDGQLIELIFEAGFSTATEVTQVSGRGIGMDVVRSEVAELGGRIEVTSDPGKGAAFTIYLPLTLAVTQAVLIAAGTQVYALPAAMVDQVQELKPDALEQAYQKRALNWLGQDYPLHYLPRLLGDEEHNPTAKNYNSVLLLKSGAQRVAIHVDELLGNQEIVVKNIGPQLARITGIAGATVLGNGKVVLILNPAQLAYRDALSVAPSRAAQEMHLAAQPASAPLIMVVDDSLTVRKITSRLLSREGYEVLTAKDGVEALQHLQDVRPVVMLVDIEMPRMDGFELTKNIRGDAATAHIPIIMITSRTAEKHRNYAKELGVDVYLGKPYQEDELLDHIERFVKQRATAN